MQRRTFLQVLAGTCASVRGIDRRANRHKGTTPDSLLSRKWKIDSRCVLSRGPRGEFDRRWSWRGRKVFLI